MKTASTSVLADQLRERIKLEGPITFHDWMMTALYDPANGYYCRSDRTKWGREGDYRTSPERSSLFAATLGRYIARLYDDAGKPSSLTIVEFGAGDGRFATALLGAFENDYPHVFKATQYVIEEISSHSSSLARKRLLPFADRVSFKSLPAVEADFGIVFSNELLDAFPVHRVTMQAGKLLEFYVTVSAEGEFDWTLDEPSTEQLAEYVAKIGVALGEGQVADINLGIKPWFQKVLEWLPQGFVITVDYGAETNELHPGSSKDPRYFGTLRSFQRHNIMENVLANPGEQDLTSTVNWSYVRQLGSEFGLRVVEFERQDKFLLAAGLLDQLEIESKRQTGEAAKLQLSNAALEMILPTRMGAHFQVLVQQK
ncbi:MAG TPA: SAM-dependent methyltransferase [Pyrinomonadaceae bacterium]|nr:SAM-dependent methyltransferase [Pyrinomonadaceae bacterium]